MMGIPNAEEIIDAVKDYVENGEVWVQGKNPIIEQSPEQWIASGIIKYT